MKIDDLKESPDFGYKQFNNRDADLSQLIKEVVDEPGGFRVYYRQEAIVRGVETLRAVGRIACRDCKESRRFPYTDANENDVTVTACDVLFAEWIGTGLGQMLYDAAIKEAAKRGYSRFWSDTEQSAPAKKAWLKRLSKRYDVVYDEKVRAFYIDLQKVRKAA